MVNVKTTFLDPELSGGAMLLQGSCRFR